LLEARDRGHFVVSRFFDLPLASAAGQTAPTVVRDIDGSNVPHRVVPPLGFSLRSRRYSL
jgi:hypothetical protein